MSLPRRHFLASGLACAAFPAVAAGVPVIGAAASLRFVLPDLVAAFRAETGQEIRVSFGSSGTISQQIRNGAPFQMFLSADESYVLALARDGFLADKGAVYALGRLAVVSPTGSGLTVDEKLAGLRDMLAAGKLRRFAIANPDHAPYGARAKEALTHVGLWDAVQPHLVIGENVGQAAQFAVSGNADGGLIAASLASSGPISGRAVSALIPAAFHSELRQRMALVPDAGNVAQAFSAFARSPDAQAIFERHGFAPPEGA